jgi:hypothetical protein
MRSGPALYPVDHDSLMLVFVEICTVVHREDQVPNSLFVPRDLMQRNMGDSLN